MKTAIIAGVLILVAGSASAQYQQPTYGGSSYGGYGTGSNPNSHSTRGYMTQGGTVVQPYHSTNPNSTQRDNYGTSGNYNPYSNTYGTRKPGY